MRVFEAASLAYLLFHTGKVPEEIADRLDVLPEGGKPVMMGDHAPHPLPDALLGIQLGRVGGLWLEHEPAPCIMDGGLDRSPLMLLSPIMDDQQAFPRIRGPALAKGDFLAK